MDLIKELAVFEKAPDAVTVSMDHFIESGFGKALLDRVILEAKEKSFVGVTWQVLDWNKPAIDFYKSYGVSLDPEWINCNLDL